MNTFLDPGIRDKAIVETMEDDKKRPFVVCAAGSVKAGMSSGHARLCADSFERATNRPSSSGHTPVTELCMLIREATTRAEEWAAK